MKKHINFKILGFALSVVIMLAMFGLPVAATDLTQDEVYQLNFEIYNSKSKDEAVLEYYKKTIEPITNIYYRGIQSNDTDIIALANSITKGITNDYEKIEAIHYWVAENISYDYEVGNFSTYDTSATNVLRTKRSICDGYAKLTVSLLRAVDIPAKYIYGFTGFNFFFGVKAVDIQYPNHAWCEAYADGRWIILDPTFASTNPWRTCFDMSLENLSTDHRYVDYDEYRLKDGCIYLIDHSFGGGVFFRGYYQMATEVIVPESVNLISAYAFSKNTSLTKIVLHDALTTIDTEAFKDCTSLRTITLPESLTSIARSAFQNCTSLNHIVIPNSVQYISDSAFKGCTSLTDVTLPNNLLDMDIPAWMFMDCTSLASISIPDSVLQITDGAFSGCTSLNSVVLPKGLVSLRHEVFAGCTNLTSLYVPASTNDFGEDIFKGCNNLTIYGEAKSPIEKYAKDNGIKFVVGQPPKVTSTLAANPTASTVLVNGNPASFDAYTINDNNYFKLRDLAYILNGTEKQFAVSWDGAANAISLTSGQAYIAVGGEMTRGDGKVKIPAPTTSTVYRDGKQVTLTAYTIGGNNYFKLRDVMRLFDVGVTYDGATNTIGLDVSVGYAD